jgi:hypothetical protein
MESLRRPSSVSTSWAGVMADVGAARNDDKCIMAIAGYVRWRNTRARPKANFATDSTIRTWTDYPTKAA